MVAHTCDPNSCETETTAYLRLAWATQSDCVSRKKGGGGEKKIGMRFDAIYLQQIESHFWMWAPVLQYPHFLQRGE